MKRKTTVVSVRMTQQMKERLVAALHEGDVFPEGRVTTITELINAMLDDFLWGLENPPIPGEARRFQCILCKRKISNSQIELVSQLITGEKQYRCKTCVRGLSSPPISPANGSTQANRKSN